MPLFIKLAECNIQDNIITITGDKFHHLAKVKRVKTGDAVSISVNHSLHIGVISQISENNIFVEVQNSVNANNENGPKITLAMCMIKGEKMDLVVQKATEIGVDCIVPLVSKRVVVKLEENRTASRIERYKRIAESAAEQAERTTVPTIENPKPLKEFLNSINPDALTLFFHERGGCSISKIKDEAAVSTEIVLLIGPEGGWDSAESELCHSAGAVFISLGKNILRAETAAIAATFVAKNLANL